MTMDDNSTTNDIPVVLHEIDWIDYMKIGILLIIFMFACPGNALIILVQVKNKCKASTDYLVMTMAIFEFLCSTLNVALQITKTLMTSKLTTVFCRFFTYSAYVTSYSSAFLLAAIAIDRYIQTCRPFNQFYNIRVAKKVCFGVAITVLVLSSPALFAIVADNIVNNCEVDAAFDKGMNIWNIVLTLLVVAVFVVISVAYIRISIFLRSRHKMRQSIQNEKAVSSKKDIPAIDVDVSLDPRSNEMPSQLSTVSLSDINTNQASQSARARSSSAKKQKENGESRGSEGVGVFDDHQEVETYGSITGKDKGNGQNKDVKRTEKEIREQKKEAAINRTTRITFSISIIYITTWTIGCVVLVTDYSLIKIVNVLSYLLVQLNCMSNPILFIAMSTKFRNSARKVLCNK